MAAVLEWMRPSNRLNVGAGLSRDLEGSLEVELEVSRSTPSGPAPTIIPSLFFLFAGF